MMEGGAGLPVGIEDFAVIRKEGFYYADKTGLIKGLLTNRSYVNLITCPRRFGKTLNMSMLKYFFERGSVGYNIVSWLKLRSVLLMKKEEVAEWRSNREDSASIVGKNIQEAGCSGIWQRARRGSWYWTGRQARGDADILNS